MRECLGWVTNCQDERRCPMNWLELAVTEIPTAVVCHVCEQDVQLVLDLEDLERHSADGVRTALPVVPCAGAPALDWPPGGQSLPQPMDQDGGHADAARADYDDYEDPIDDRVMYVTLLSGDTIKLDKDAMIIGRSRTCDVVIPSAKVSRQHASITIQGGDWYVEDLGSANGVWREGEKISRARIHDGDVFTISEETLTFELR